MGKGQFAMEYLLVVGFSLLVFIPVISLLYSEYDANRSEVYAEHLTTLSKEITYQAEKIYFGGYPSSTTISAHFPPGISSVNIEDGVISFIMSDHSFIPTADFSVPVVGSIDSFQGPHKLFLSVDDAGTVDPLDDFVLIRDK